MTACDADAYDNTGAMPWTDEAARSGKMKRGLADLVAQLEKIRTKRDIVVQFAFLGVSADSCWNVVRALNDFPGLCGMVGKRFNAMLSQFCFCLQGGVVNQDGMALTPLLANFVNKFLQTRVVEASVTVSVAPAHLKVRFLDTSRPSVVAPSDNKDTAVVAAGGYGAAHIQSEFSKGQATKRLGVLAAGQELALVVQVQLPLNDKNDGRVALHLNHASDELRLTARLTGDVVVPLPEPRSSVAAAAFASVPEAPRSKEEKASFFARQKLLAEITSGWRVAEDEEQFDQAPDKFGLRLQKQQVNLQCVIDEIFVFLDGNGARAANALRAEHKEGLEKLKAKLATAILDIQKDRTQEVQHRWDRIKAYVQAQPEAAAKALLPSADAIEQAIQREQSENLRNLFYYPAPVPLPAAIALGEEDAKGSTEWYNVLVQDARVLQFFLSHPVYSTEAAAKAFEFVRPDTLMDRVRAVFGSFAMPPEASRVMYRQVFEAPIESPVDTSDTTVIRALSAAEVAAATAAASAPTSSAAEPAVAVGDSKSATPTQADIKETHRQLARSWRSFHAKNVSSAVGAFPREILLAVVHHFLQNGISPEEVERLRQQAADNAERSRQRYRHYGR